MIKLMGKYVIHHEKAKDGSWWLDSKADGNRYHALIAIHRVVSDDPTIKIVNITIGRHMWGIGWDTKK